MAQCVSVDGYFYASSKPNAPHYIYDKMVGGLVDSFLYCGNQKALDHLSRITDWAIPNLDRTRRDGDTSTEWYTLSENLYRAYLATGERKYKQFAAVWEYPEYWNLFERRADPFAVRPSGHKSDAYHAYSHVNTLGGAGAAYLVTGDRAYLSVLINAYDYFQKHQMFATGGYGPDEQLLPLDVLAPRLGMTHNTFETQCGTWAVFKLVKYLIAITGDARYGDWAERVAWNGLFAGIPMSADGRVFYYSDYNSNGGAKHNNGIGWTCCTGTRPQAIADFCDLIYFHGQDGLYVNQFAPSRIRWRHGGNEVTLQQVTRFPEDGMVEMTVQTPGPKEFRLGIRKPAWLTAPVAAELNGAPVSLTIDSANWATVRREWHNGDRLTIALPLGLTASTLGSSSRFPAAILYGPVVLAARAADAKFVAKLDLAHLEQSLVPVPGEVLTWRMKADPSVLLRPFYSYKENEPYYVYLDPAAARRIPVRNITFSGKWQEAPLIRFTNEIGARAETTFEGTGIRWLGHRFDDAGQAEVKIDGNLVGRVSQYGPGRDLPFDWSRRNLKPGRHTIIIRLLPDKLPDSRDRYINIAGFELLE
jgi:DUF1680 family protein